MTETHDKFQVGKTEEIDRFSTQQCNIKMDLK